MNKHVKQLGAALLASALVCPMAFATLTNSNANTQYSAGTTTNVVYSALVTAASNDTTATADSNVITNLDGSVKDVCVFVKATNQTGTSPTLTLSLIESQNASGPWYAAKSGQSGTAGTIGTMNSGALDISSASTTNVGTGFCASQFGRTSFAPYFKVRTSVGGTSGGWTGVVSGTVKK